MIEGQKSDFAEAESPDPEVTAKAKRRSFSAPYKKILTEVEAAAGTGNNWRDPAARRNLFFHVDELAEGTRCSRGRRIFTETRPEPKRNPLTGDWEGSLRIVSFRQ
jgi:hypothetical protein